MRAGRGTSRARQLASCFLLPDAYRPWKPFALREVRRCLREEPIDVLMTTSSPDTAHLVGLDVKRESGVPWVADFRDPWTRRIAFDPPTAWHRRWHEAREAEVLRAADRVIVTSNETRDDFVARHESLALTDVAVVPNGFDPDDFPPIEAEPSWDTFDLVYVGQLTARRTVAPLLPIVERFFADHPEARAHTRIRFVGPREVENDEHVRARGLGDVVSFESPRPHAEATHLLRRAHVVLLVEHMGARAGLIAQGKLYECLYAGRPILGAVPHGAVTRLLDETGGGVGVSNEDEVPRGSDLLASAYAAWRERRVLPGANSERIARFERRSLASDLAGELEGVTERS
jgi:glycosyltransferase involved in cell wall biosynthesis